MRQFLEEWREKERLVAEQRMVEEQRHWDEESTWTTRALIMDMLKHDSTSMVQYGERRTVLECNKQDQDNVEDSPNFYKAEPNEGAGIRESTTSGLPARSRWRRHKESSHLHLADTEGQSTEPNEGNLHLQSKTARDIDQSPVWDRFSYKDRATQNPYWISL